MDINELIRRLERIYVWMPNDNPIRHELVELINIFRNQIHPDGLMTVPGEIIKDEEEIIIFNTDPLANNNNI